TGLAATLVLAVNTNTLSFGSEPVGTASSVQTLSISNTGNTALALTSIVLSDTSDYLVEFNNCGTQISANGQCQIQSAFKPTTAGSLPATVTITSSDATSGSPQVVNLSGTGLVVTKVLAVNSNTFSFGSEPVGTASSVQTLSISNTGNTALALTSIVLSEDRDRPL